MTSIMTTILVVILLGCFSTFLSFCEGFVVPGKYSSFSVLVHLDDRSFCSSLRIIPTINDDNRKFPLLRRSPYQDLKTSLLSSSITEDNEENNKNNKVFQKFVSLSDSVQEGFNNFKNGSLDVHRNLLKHYFRLTFIKLFLPIIFCLSLFIIPKTTMKIQKHIVRGFSSIVAIESRFMDPILKVFQIMYNIFKYPKLIFTKDGIIKLWNFIRCFFKGTKTQKIGGHFTPAYQNQHFLSKVSSAVLFAPIIEEIIFRQWFYKLWQFVGRQITSQTSRELEKSSDKSMQSKNPQYNLSSKKRLWFGYKPWIVVSSSIFGLIHLSNHLPINSDHVNTEVSKAMAKFNTEDKDLKKDVRKLLENRLGFTTVECAAHYGVESQILFGAIAQLITTTYIGLNLLGPLYNRYGLLGSIGAHAAWNLSVTRESFISLRIFFRLIIRPLFRQCLKAFNFVVQNKKPKEE